MGSPPKQLKTSDGPGIVGDTTAYSGVTAVAAMLSLFVAKLCPALASDGEQVIMTAGFAVLLGFGASLLKRYLADTRP